VKNRTKQQIKTAAIVKRYYVNAIKCTGRLLTTNVAYSGYGELIVQCRSTLRILAEAQMHKLA